MSASNNYKGKKKRFVDLSPKEHASHMYNTIRLNWLTYIFNTFPIIKWLPKYNRRWLLGDLTSGLTVGIMIVPQSLAYAKLANLPVVYGLYSGLICTLLYPFMGTSREVSVGPTAMLSLIVGDAVNRAAEEYPDYSAVDVAVALTFLTSLVVIALGVFRLGILLDLVPNPVIVGFTTGAAFTIILTQTPTLLGIPNVSSNDPTVTTIYNFFKNIPKLNWVDLVFGISSLIFIFTLNFISKRLTPKYPLIRFLKVSSNGLAAILFTVISYSCYKTQEDFNLKIVKDVPQGFSYIGIPNLDTNLLSAVSLDILPCIVVGVLEHVALCKAFARQANYQISSSQELFSLGVSNLCASFFQAYPATGSFSRSAVVSQSGVRTPLAGFFTGLIVLMALSFLTPAFYYIPNPTLAAIIIVSAVNLISSYKTVTDLWKVQKTDSIIFLLAAFATFFAGAEIGIGSSLGLAFLVLLYDIARPHLYLLSQVKGRPGVFIDHKHPGYETTLPLPGVIVVKPQESLIFPNIEYFKDEILDLALLYTQSGAPPTKNEDKLWCDDISDKARKLRENLLEGVEGKEELPILRAIVFDFSSVNRIDSSGLQGLFDIRDTLIKYAGTGDSNIELNKNSDIEGQSNNHINFEMHFVSAFPQVLRVLELSRITQPIASFIPYSFTSSLGHNNGEAYRFATNTLEDAASIVTNASKFVHLTVKEAIEKLQRH